MVFAIAAVIVVAVFGFGQVVDVTYQKATSCISDQGNGEPFPNCPSPAP